MSVNTRREHVPEPSLVEVGDNLVQRLSHFRYAAVTVTSHSGLAGTIALQSFYHVPEISIVYIDGWLEKFKYICT